MGETNLYVPVFSNLYIPLGPFYYLFAIFVIVESRRIGMRHGWAFLVVGLFVAFAFAFPLFLLLRERHLRKTGAA